MAVDVVEVVRAEHSAQTDHPIGGTGGRDAEAPDRSSGGRRAALAEVRFPRQEVCDGRFDRSRVAVPGLLREPALGAPRGQPHDQPKNRQGRVNRASRPLGGDHAR
jgi:hypothetical protein